MTVADIVDEIVRREGGFVNHPADRGGPTNMGITIATLSWWRKTTVTVDDVRNLSHAEAVAIYADQYVKPWLFVTHDALRALVVDFGVTSGPDDPAKALQRYMKTIGLYAGKIDGVAGPKTRAAYAAMNEQQQHAAYPYVLSQRYKHFVAVALDEFARRLIREQPKCQLANLAGWINRATEFNR